MRRLGIVASIVVAATLAISAAYAQSQQRHRLRGTITSVAPGTIVVTDRDGKAVTVKTTSATQIVSPAPGTLQDIKLGDRVRVMATKAQDGSLTAVRIGDVPSGLQLPGGGKGGQRELQSGRVVVAGTVVSVQANVLSISAENAAVTTVSLPPNVPVQRMTLLPATSLAKGARVALQGTDNGDGTVTAAIIMVAPGQPR